MQWHSGNFWTPSEPTVRFGFLCKLTDGEAQRKMCLGVTELGDNVHLGGNDKHKPVIKSKINVENNGLATHCRGDKYSCTFPQMHACLPVCDSHVKHEHDDDIYQSSIRATNVWFVIYVQAEAAAVCMCTGSSCVTTPPLSAFALIVKVTKLASQNVFWQVPVRGACLTVNFSPISSACRSLTHHISGLVDVLVNKMCWENNVEASGGVFWKHEDRMKKVIIRLTEIWAQILTCWTP